MDRGGLAVRVSSREAECYDRWASRKVPPLQESDSPDDQLDAFPLRDADAPRPLEPGWALPARAAYTEPVAQEESAELPLLFASTGAAPQQRGVSAWLIAAASLVIGIAMGFASGYRIGQGQVENTPAVDQDRSPASTSGSATPGKPFSESTVEGPVRLEEQPIVPAPETPAKSAPAPQRPPAPAPAPASASATKPSAPPRAIMRPAPERARPAETVATGPASIEVVSRPSGARVFIDDRFVGTTPMSVSEVPVGSHEIRLELAAFNRWSTTVDVKAGNATRVAASLEQ